MWFIVCGESAKIHRPDVVNGLMVSMIDRHLCHCIRRQETTLNSSKEFAVNEISSYLICQKDWPKPHLRRHISIPIFCEEGIGRFSKAIPIWNDLRFS